MRFLTLLFLILTFNCQAQQTDSTELFEGKIVYKVYERYEDEGEVVPEDSIVVYYKDNFALKQAYSGGEIFYFSLLRNDTLYSCEGFDAPVVYEVIDTSDKDYSFSLSETIETITHRKGFLAMDHYPNMYFVLFEQQYHVPFQIYPIMTSNLPAIISYSHIYDESYTHEMSSIQKQELPESLFALPTDKTILPQDSYIPVTAPDDLPIENIDEISE